MSTLIVPPSYSALPSNEPATNGIRTMRVEEFHAPAINYGDRRKDEVDNTNGYAMCPPAVDENDDDSDHENFFESMSSKLSTLLQRKHFPILRREERLQSTPV
jgi:hypothetical protein